VQWDAASKFAGVILAALPAFAAGEDVKESAPDTLSIAAAADLRFSFDDLVKQFEQKNTAVKINVTYGSSGNFFAQLQNGAPFDLFFSADVAYPCKLAEKGLGVDDVFLYASGRIVLWAPQEFLAR
jgi:molybdate transport system substrate-binding protein